MGASTLDRPPLPPGFFFQDDPALSDPMATLPPGFELATQQQAEEVIPPAQPGRIPSPSGYDAPSSPEAIPEIKWDRSKDGTFKVLPDGRVVIDPERFDIGLDHAFESGIIDGKTYGELKPDADAFRSALEERRQLEKDAGALPEAKAFLQGAGRAGAMTMGFLGGAKGGAAVGALTGPAAAVASPILAILAGVGGSVAADKAYSGLYEKLAENDAEFASYLAARQAEPMWGMAGELSGIVLPVAAGGAQMAKAVSTIAQSEGPKAAALFAGKIMGTGAVAGAAIDPIVRGVDRVLTPEQSPAEILRDGAREVLPILDAGSMAASAALMSAMSTIAVGNRRFNQADIHKILTKPEAKWTRSERDAVVKATEIADSLAKEFGAGVRGADLLLRQVTVSGQPVATAGSVRAIPPPAGNLPGRPVASGTVAPGAPASAAGQPALPGPTAGQAVAVRGGAPMPPAPTGPIAAGGGAVRAALPPPPEGFSIVEPVATDQITVPGAGGKTVPVPVAEVPPAVPKSRKGFSTSFVHSELTPVISWIAENNGLRRTAGGNASGENDALADSFSGWGPWGRVLLNNRGMSIDEAVSSLWRSGLIPEPSADALRAAVDSEISTYRKVRDETKAQDRAVKEYEKEHKQEIKQARNFGERVATPRKGMMEFPISALQVGDVVTVDGHKIKVADMDPDTWEVTLENGVKFGVQTLSQGEVIFAEKAELVPREDSFLGADDAPAVPAVPAVPAKPPVPTIDTVGEGNLFAEQDMPFNLAGETDITPELQKIADAKRTAKEAQEAMDRDQTDMFAGQHSGNPAQPSGGPVPGAAKVPDWALQPPETPKGGRLTRGVERQDRKGMGFRDIVDFVNDAVGVEMRRSKSQTSKRHPAHFMPTGHLARTRETQSQINFHEAGHGVQFMLLARQPDIFLPVKAELKALTQRQGSMASKGPDEAYQIGEGVAEWIRLRITDPQAVEGMAAGAAIEVGLNKHYPGVAAAIRDAARAHHKFQNLPAAVRWAKFNQGAQQKPGMKELWNAALRMGTGAANALASGSPLSRYDRGIFRAIIKDRQEVGLSYRQAVKAAREVRQLTSEVMENYNLILSIGAEVQMAISGKGEMRGIRMVGLGSKIRVLFPKTWQEIVKQVPGARYEQFEQAGWALESLNRYAKDRMEYPGMREGITPEDLLAIVKQAEKDIPNFKQLFLDVQKYFDALLDMKDLGGLKASGEVEKMRRRETYWPMPRALETMGSGGAGRPRGQVTAGDYRAYGSGEAIMDLNTVAEQRTREAMTAFYWNQLGHSIVTNFRRIAKDTKLPMEARTLAGRAMVPLKMEQQVAATLSREEVQRMVYSAVLAQRAADLGLSPAEIPSLAMQFKPEDINLAFNFKDIYRPTAPHDVNVVSLLDGGERKFFQIFDDGLFMMFARPDQVSAFTRGAAWLIVPAMQNVKRTITQNPVFAINSIARDAFTSMMLNPNASGWVPGGVFMLGMWNKFSRKYPQVFQEGILLSRSQPSSVELVNALKENVAINWLMEGWYQAQDKDPTMRLLKTWLNPNVLLFPFIKLSDAWNLITGGRFISPMFETAVREGSAVEVLMRGGTDRAAMNAYWERVGRFNEHSGVADARTILSFGMFVNPMLQGVRGVAQVLTDPDPSIRMGAWAKLLLMVPAAFGAGAVARFLMMDEDERNRERERPIEDRMNSYDMAGFRLMFPYGPEGVMASFVYNSVMDDLLGRPKEDGRKTGLMLLKRIADVGTPLQFLGPQINAVMEANMNWSNYQQRHIVSPWMVNAPASEQYASTTPEFYRKLGKWTDYSPAKIQYIVRQGISRQTDEVIRLLSDIEAGRGPAEMFQESADIPFVGRLFIREPLGFGAQSVQTMADLDDKVALLNKRLGTAGYSWIKDAPMDQLPVQLQAIRQQWDALEMLRAGSRQLEMINSMATASKLGNDMAGERNYRRAMVLYAQSILAVNPQAAERIEMAIEMLEHVPEASPQMKQADYLERRF